MKSAGILYLTQETKGKVEFVGKTAQRRITLNQLKEILEEICQDKLIHDQKCIAIHLPIETMEQYLYTYLYQKYGLKQLIIEWAVGLVNAVNMYMKFDPDIMMFAKILKNEFEENFKFVHQKVKATVLSIIKEKLRARHIHKTEIELDFTIEEMSTTIIPEFLWKSVLDDIYDSYDRIRIEDSIWKKQDRRGLKIIRSRTPTKAINRWGSRSPQPKLNPKHQGIREIEEFEQK